MKKFYETKQFQREQAKWYKKLENSGFDDIEWTDHKTGKGQNSPHLKRSVTAIQKKLNNFHATHFASCENFTTHWTFTPKTDEILMRLYSKGHSLREITKLFNSAYPSQRASLFVYWQKVSNLKAWSDAWNRSDPNGLFNDTNSDFEVYDLELDGNWHDSE